MAERWNVDRHYNFGDGMIRNVTPVDPKFPDSAAFDLTNMVYNGDSDNPSGMYGATIMGASIGDVVSGLFDYNNGDKLVAAAEDGDLYEWSGSAWVNPSGARATGNSTTADVRWHGEMFYGATTSKNLLILTNGTDAPVRYDTTNGAVTLGGSPPSTGNFPTPWQGRLWLAEGSTLYGCAVDNCEEWSTGAVSLPIYRGYDGDITGLAAFANNLFIFKRSSVFRIGPTSSFAAINIKNVSTKSSGCIASKSIHASEVGDTHTLTWMSEHGTEVLVPSDVSGGFSPVNIMRPVKPIYDNRNVDKMATAWGVYNHRRGEYYAMFPIGSQVVPTGGLVANTARSRNKARWTFFSRNNLTAGVVFNESNTDYVQIVGDSDGNIYKMHDTSTVDWNGVPFSRNFVSRVFTQGLPERTKKYGWIFTSVDRFGIPGVNVNARILTRSTTSAPPNIEGVDTVGSKGWGAGGWGTEPWGGAIAAGQRIRPQSRARGHGLQVAIEGTGVFTVKGVEVASRPGSSKSRA